MYGLIASYIAFFDNFCSISDTGGLNFLFVHQVDKCLLDYMEDDLSKLPYYLRNFLQIYKQIISALKYFEEKACVHRDIKCELYFLYYIMQNVDNDELHRDGKILTSKNLAYTSLLLLENFV